MSHNLVSSSSIEDTMMEELNKEQYISNLKVQCRMREQALRTAESLILAYQKQNQSLREQIKNIKSQLLQKQEKLIERFAEETIVKQLQKNILKYSQKVNELLEKNINYEQKIHHLEKELQKVKKQQQNEKQMIRQKLSRVKKQQLQKKELQSHFRNYLKIADRQSSFQSSPKIQRNSPGKQSFITAVTRNERQKGQSNMKVLEWKLKQKDQEIVILLKRLNQLQERTQAELLQNRRERVLTADSLDNFYSHKKNVSQFIQ